MARGDRTWIRPAGVMALILAIGGGQAAALNSPDQFCTGDPCVISSAKSVDPGAVLDFGTRAVVLQNTLNLLPQPSGAIGSVTIKAGSFSITGSAGQITGFSASAAGGSVEIDVVNDIQITGTIGTGAVRLAGQDSGSLTLTTTNGSVSVSSRLSMYGNGTYASAGTLTINSAGSISLTGQLDFYGGAQGEGGDLELTAVGDVTLTGPLDLTGGGCGGCLDIQAGGSLALGQVDMSGTGQDADGGLAEIDVGGAVQMLGTFWGRGADQGQDCGDGAEVDISAGDDITVTGDVDIRGRGSCCSGGCLSLDGDTVSMQSNMLLSGTGSDGDGGELDAYGQTLISFTGSLALDGGSGGAGAVFFSSLRAAQVLGTINVNGRTPVSSGAEQAEFDATTLTFGGSIDASSGDSSVAGGQIVLNACDVVTQPSAVLEALGNLGSITATGSRSIKLRGAFTASANGGNTARYTQNASPPDTSGAIFSPPLTLILDNTIPPCPVCNTNADCTDGNPCTDDVCNGGTSCQHTPRSTGTCDDGNLCTTGDTCVAGTCVGGPALSCNDGNPCTADSCAPAVGCVYTPTPGSCDDGNQCTTGDTCSGGTCVGTPINCSDGNPCTDDACSGGVCSHTFNNAPCGSGNPCTSQDTCSGGVCVAGPPLDCNDQNVCTTDSCDPTMGCQHAAIAGCVDSDHDGKTDNTDECTTVTWTTPPTNPPDEDPLKFGLVLSRLTQPNGSQSALIKGLFNVAPSEQLPINPTANGVHVYAEDAGGTLLSVSLPGGAGCIAGDGWMTFGVGFHKIWMYRNRSGKLPPACTPGSAAGVEQIQIKDQRLSGRHGLQFKVQAKNATLLRHLATPLTRVEVALALAAQPSPGVASPQAKAGQCAEALFTGNPIASKGRPSCKPKLKTTVLDGATCKGE